MTEIEIVIDSYRCRICETMWPMLPEYRYCPNCREPTADAPHPPISEEEARKLAAHANFGWWLWENERA